MKREILDFLKQENIDLYGVCDASGLTARLPHILRNGGFAPSDEEEGRKVSSLLCMCFPYFCGYPDNFSAYASAPDYHAYCADFFARFTALLNEVYPSYHFHGFADKSPYDEVALFEKAGLGKRGDNMLFLTEKYSSFVFLGEVATDMPADEWELEARALRDLCLHCGKCKRACPGYEADEFFCLSALTQEKGELTEEKRSIIKKYGSAWGCDICQQVCPVTQNAIENGTVYTPIEYFKNNRITKLTRELVENMSDEEFKSRAFAWRGKKTVLRNLDILDER